MARRPRVRVLTVATALGLAAVVTAAVAVVVLNQPSSQAEPPPTAAALPETVASPPPATGAPAQSPPQTPVHTPRGPSTTAPAARRLSTFWGIDVSWPQCGMAGLPPLSTGFVTVGVNGGRPFTANPCLAQQVTYAKAHSGYGAYLNIDAPRGVEPTAYGRRVALDGLARARAAGLRPPVLWLDVEVLNHWADPATNVAVINGALRAVQSEHVTAGVYSSVAMWRQITGGATLDVPVWLATTVTDYRTLDPLCATGLGGRPAVLAQYVATTGRQLIDVDVLCTATREKTVGMFAAGAS